MSEDNAMETQGLRFCELCLSQYRELRYDRDRMPPVNFLPFGTVLWHDEHPFIGGRFGPYVNHPEASPTGGTCFMTSAMLIAARGSIWETGALQPKYAEFWNAARRTIPLWPGFNRVDLKSIPDQQKPSLPLCLQRVAGLTAYCPQCQAELRTHLAEQCLECGADWHKPIVRT